MMTTHSMICLWSCLNPPPNSKSNWITTHRSMVMRKSLNQSLCWRRMLLLLSRLLSRWSRRLSL